MTTLCAAHSLPLCRECNRTQKAPFGTERKPLKTKRSTRHIRQGDYLKLIGQAKSAQSGRCAGLIADPRHECAPGDPFDACHVVSQQTLVKAFGEGCPALTDPRNVLYACRSIHSKLDSGHLELFRPAGFTAFCREHGIEHNGRYWAVAA